MTLFRAPNEIAWSTWLAELGVDHRYEALEPALARGLRYQPDFWLGEALAWLEIKPVGHKPTEGEARVARDLATADNNPVYLAAGWPQSTGLALYCWYPSGTYSHWEDWQAINQLSLLLDKRPALLEAASAAVMRRRREFTAAWRITR